MPFFNYRVGAKKIECANNLGNMDKKKRAKD